MARTSHKDDSLIELVTNLYAEPSYTGAAHVGGDDAYRFFVGVIESPLNADRPCGRAGPDKSSSRKSVEIELNPAFQTAAGRWARHSAPLDLQASLARLARKKDCLVNR
jgi:hypothetical protein